MYKFLKQVRDIKNSNAECYRSPKITHFHESTYYKEIHAEQSTKSIDQFMYIIYQYCDHLPQSAALKMNLDLLHCEIFTWGKERLIWIAFYKETGKINESKKSSHDHKKNMFSQLPKDLVKYIISFADNKKDSEKITFQRIEKNMKYIVLKYIWNESYYAMNISWTCRNRLLRNYKKVRKMASICSSGTENDTDNDTKKNDDNTDNDSFLDNIPPNTYGIDINSVLGKIDALNDDYIYSDDDLVDFVMCFDEALLEIIYLMVGSIQRFARTKEYARFIKHFTKKQDDQYTIYDHDMRNFELTMDRANDGDDSDNFNHALNVHDEQKKFHLEFIEPTRK